LNGAGTGGVILSGAISNGGGTLALALNNAGTVTLGGTSPNTYSGGTTISSGLVQLAGASALGSGPLSISAGTLNLGGFSQSLGSFSGGTIWNNSGAGIATLSPTGGGTYTGVIADNDGVHTGGAVALQLAISGELTMTGPNTYSGGTTVSGGTLNLINSTAIGSGPLTMAGGNLDNSSGGPVVLGANPQTWNSSFTYVGGSLLDLGTGPVTVNAPPTVTVLNSSGTLEIDGNISSSFALTTSGAGTVVLAGSNTISAAGNALTLYSNLTSSGTTSISSGNVLVQPGTTFALASGLFTANSSIVAIGNATSSSAATMLVSGGTYSQPTGNLAIGQHAPGVLTINGGLVALANALEFTIPAGTSPGTLNLNGGQLNVPYFTIVAAASEQVNFNGGLLQLANSSANLFGTAPADFTANIGNGGMIIDLNGYSTTISNSLIGTGSGGLTVYATTPGTLTLGGNNAYSGPTQINAGTVVLDATGTNSGSLGSTNVNVSSGATLVVRGNTSIGTGNLGVAGGGTLDLRDNSANTYFNVNGNLSLGSGTQGSNLYFELGSYGNDELNVAGSAALSGTSTINLSVVAGSSPSIGQYNLIFANSGLSAGNFNVVPPSLKGFDTFSLATPTPTALVVTVSGNPTPYTAYWTGLASAALSDTANLWGVGASISTSNWSTTPDGLTDPLQVPGAITDVYFTAANATGVAGSLTTTLDNPYSIAGMFFAVSSGSITSVTLSTGSNTLTLGYDGLTLAATSNASGTISGSGALLLNGYQNWANNSNSQPLTVTLPISPLSGITTLSLNGSGTGGVTLSGVISNGPGTLSLSFAQSGTTVLGGSAANTYSGGTTISAGLVRLANAGALGNTAGPLTINGGALDLNGFSPTIGVFSGAAGTVLNNSGSGVATLTVGQGNSNFSNFSGTIADNDGVHTGGAVALNIIGSGELTLAGTNTYSGGTTVNGGATLNLVSNSAIGSGMLTMAGGNLDNNSGGPVVLGANPQTWNSSFTYLGGSLLNLGTGPVTMNVPTTITVQNSSGTLEIDGNITSGTSELQTAGQGTVILTGSDSITVPGTNVASFASNVLSTGTLNLSGGNFLIQPGTTFTVATGLVSASSVGGVGTVIGNGAGGTAYMVVSGGTFAQTSATLYIAQHSAGVLTIANTGLVTVGASPLAFNYNGAPTQGIGVLNLNGGTLQSAGFSNANATPGQTVNFDGGVLELTATSANLFGANAADFAANVGDGGIFINLSGYSTTISNALVASGSGGLTLSSAEGGYLILTGVNTYTGGTIVNGGTLIVESPSSLLDGSSLTVGQGAAAIFAPATGSPAAPAGVAAVPEPGTVVLLVVALSSAGVFWRVRRR
jgi:fibronectin-binding autotransporter adhesin